MVGRLTFPRTGEKDVDTHERTVENEDSQRPPSYTDHSVSPYITETMTTTVTTTTQTTQTTHFFSLPLWRRRAVPAMVSAMSEGPHASSSILAEEDGRIARSVSYNTDKELPAVPHYDRVIYPAHTRQSASSQRELVNRLNAEDMAHGIGPSRASVSVPPHTQSARTLAQAGLGIGLPHVMPSAAASSPRTSFSRSPRPSTAPRPSSHLEPSSKIRRVRSFSRAQSEVRLSESSEADEKLRGRKKSATLSVPKSNETVDALGPPATNSEPRAVTKRASFWSRRRVQSLKDPPENLAQNIHQPPVPALPTFQPVSPMFPNRDLQSSPGSSPLSPELYPASRLRRRHSERSASLSSSPHLSPLEVTFTDPPPVPKRSPHRPPPPGENNNSDDVTIRRSVQDPVQRPIPMSFITTPSISRFPPMDERLSRPRSMTNPSNLLHRLSMGIFNPSAPSSPISSPTVSTSIMDENTLSSSPRNSASLLRSSLSKSTVEIPKPKADEESPDVFLGRLEEAVSKAEIANILAGSGDSFYTQALQLYINRFDFTNNPLDIALRKLLMDVGLPKETQQIDRVMEAFATNYSKCNPGLFVSDDHPYILAFSLIMLHTDVFNKSNKRKMTKADYIKNTKLVGISNEVLDYFFDNIVFAPFIFIEDPVDVNGQRGLTQDSKIISSVNGQATPTASGSGLSMLGKSNKIDPYYLITRDLLGPLRVDVESHIPLRNPFSYQGTAGSWNEGELRRSFARADVIEVDNMESRRMSTMPLFSMNVTGAPGPMLTSFAGPVFSEPENSLPEISRLRITKVGLLNRKDDLSDGGKRTTSRKWREWSVILTGSQLLLFRDSGVALDFIAQGRSAPENGKFSTQISYSRPDELMSVKDAIAVYDSSYVKHNNVLRLVMPSGRQLLLQAESESQRNEWIAHINYASAFKTAGIRMRPVSAMEDARMDASSYTRDAAKIPSKFQDSSTELVSEGESIAQSLKESSSAKGVSLHVQGPLSSEFLSTQSRSRVMSSKIQDFETKIKTTQGQLDSDIRIVRNIAILTPFQRSTRDRLQASITSLGRHIRQLRLDVVKTACFRDVLAADLASEERERGRCRKDLAENKSRHIRRKDDSIPRMTLSVHEDDMLHESSSRSLSHSDLSDLSHGHAESSICESFHSALDFGTDWPLNSSVSPQRRATQSFETSSPLISPINEAAAGKLLTPNFLPSLSPVKAAHDSSTSTAISADGDSPNLDGTHQSGLVDVIQETTEEQAEEWNKTRAARRVSLVRVPHGLKVAARLDKESWRENTQAKEDHGNFDGVKPSSRDSSIFRTQAPDSLETSL